MSHSTHTTRIASTTSGSVDSHCKISATERGVLLSLKQLSKNCTSGKIGRLLFVALPFSKYSVDIETHLRIMKHLQQIEMLYGIRLMVACCTVAEMQNVTNVQSINADYFALSEDEINKRTYMFVTAPTKGFAPDKFV